MKKDNQRGFTLIELIMVMVILGILAAVAVPKFFDFATTAHTKNKDAVIGSVKVGLNNYAANTLLTGGTRTYPQAGSLAFTSILDETPDNWSIVSSAGDDTIRYAGDNTDWVYDTVADSTTYTLTAQ